MLESLENEMGGTAGHVYNCRDESWAYAKQRMPDQNSKQQAVVALIERQSLKYASRVNCLKSLPQEGAAALISQMNLKVAQ